jgi:dCTP deaminase
LVEDRNELQKEEIGTISAEWLGMKGMLSGPYISERITNIRVDHESHLAVIPFDPEAIQGASLDVHLGNWFVVARKTKLKGVQIGNLTEENLLQTVGREEFFVPEKKIFVIHPGDLILGITKEFIALPSDLMAFVEGKSGLGRKGLIVATATQGPTATNRIFLPLRPFPRT